MSELNIFEEANRQLVICNACRYCEGFCAVFQAIETRRDFSKSDVFYLSNLCHDCRACYYACMFTPPHEFAINIPQVMADVRVASYRHWSWPGLLARSFTDRKTGAWLAVLGFMTVILVATLLISPGQLLASHVGPGAFYKVVPYLAMVIPAMFLFAYAVAIWVRGGFRFWSEVGDAVRKTGGARTLARALGAALGLRYLGGGGPGCPYPEERPSEVRRVYHSFVFWGFLSDFVSTSLAFVYEDLFHRLPPYALTSAPVIFGALGGIALIIGTAGLIGIKWKSDREPAYEGAYRMDYTFLVTLGLVALTGMITLLFRATPALGSLLVVHLATVAALFITAPYGKFVHFVYRSLALIVHELEQQAVAQNSK